MANRKSLIDKRSTLYAVRSTKKGFVPPRAGFTLVEMLTVLAIMTIIMAFAVPMFSRFTAGTRLGTASRDISTALRTARSYAITQRDTYSVKFDLDNQRYWLFYVDAGTTNIVDKAFSLPETVEIGVGGISNPEPTQTNSTFAFNFQPSGTVNSNTIWLWDTKGRTNWITLVGTTGRVKIKKEKEED